MISQNHLKDVNSSSTEALHKEKEAYDHQMERIKTQFMQERMQYKDALKDYSNEICILKEKNDKIKETMDLQKDAYLSKVHDLKKIIKKLESESDSLKNAKDSQASELQEIKNKQSTFFQFLQTELANPIV
jgi:predicted RNase H-like nuclease (RuvC/YqgF family)